MVFGFWHAENEVSYPKMKRHCQTVSEFICGMIGDKNGSEQKSSQYQQHEPQPKRVKCVIQEEDEPQEEEDCQEDQQNLEQEGILQLPHLGISQHYTTLNGLQEFIFTEFQKHDSTLTQHSNPFWLERIANQVNNKLPEVDPLVVFGIDPNDNDGLCISWLDIDETRWSTLPFGYAPYENPFDSQTANKLMAINPEWRKEFATMNPSQELLKATGELQLFYFTEMGEKRYAEKLMNMRNQPNEKQEQKQKVQRIDLSLKTSDLLSDEEFQLVKTGFGQKELAIQCECCKYRITKQFLSWQDYITEVKIHYLKHGDYGLATFIYNAEKCKESFILSSLRNKSQSKKTNDIMKKCVDVEFGYLDEQGWHNDDIITDIQAVNTQLSQ